MSFLAGQYTATWNSLALGQTLAGHGLNHQRLVQQIRGDTYAETVQDAINQGADVYFDMELIEANAACLPTILWPLSGTVGSQGLVGLLDSGKWMSLILTAVAGTPAAATPASITAARTLIKENFNVRQMFAPKLRTVPLQLRAYPNAGVFWTQT